ncbi:MAG: hypothetical protein ABI597_10695 [Gammaproteobacteria bacterium]
MGIKLYWCRFYFCEPSSPYQKGAIENCNGNIRIKFQRDYDTAKLKQRDLNAVINTINNRPLKCVGYLTPHEEFYKKTSVI